MDEADKGRGDRSSLPADLQQTPLSRAREALEGLACGDAFGECFFQPHYRAPEFRSARKLPPGPWPFTDDTLMAASIFALLARRSEIESRHLAASFAFHHDPDRGYGAAMNGLLLRLHALGTENWFEEAQALFGGQGSMGNGAAMRVAPVGAYFAGNLQAVVSQATLSAIATHCHPDAVAGSVAVAVAAALASEDRENTSILSPQSLLEQVIESTPAGRVRDAITAALRLSPDTDPLEAALTIGNGVHGTARDTVPFALWCAARHLGNYEEALWSTIAGGGDMDTNCAIVGGIVVMRTGINGIPTEWRQRREPLDPLLETMLRRLDEEETA